jgi:hypothetical protein
MAATQKAHKAIQAWDGRGHGGSVTGASAPMVRYCRAGIVLLP